MKQLLFSLLLTVSTVVVATSQTVTIKGRVISSEDNLPVIGATVRLNLSDTTKLNTPGRAVATDVNGRFTITSREKKSDITVTYLGLKDYFVEIPDGQRTVDLKTITLEPGAITIDAAVVTAQGTMAKIKGDTVQFNASNFKANPDATAEDLIKKMPGVTTETDGTVSSQGQKITKVMVNGKEFFENDPSLALKSLPGDAVESVQMFDDQTDNAKFSGMDDGERVRTINIVTKAGVMRSIFGRAWLGYGTDERYSAGIGASIFNDAHRWTITAATNNVNNQGFSLSDLGGGGGGGRGMSRAEGVSTGSFMTNARGGINQSTNVGINYNGTFSPKFKLSAQYSYGNINGSQRSSNSKNYTNMERYSSDSTFAKSFDNRHNFSARIEWKPNDKNRINFNPSASYGLNQGYSGSMSTTTQGMTGPLVNGSVNAYDRKYASYSAGASLWWQHAFKKSGRTMSLGAQASASKAMGDNFQNSLYSSTVKAVIAYDTIDRIANLGSTVYSLTGSATYNEPIGQYSKISANYNINYNRTMANQEGLNWNDVTREYAFLDTATTNYLNRNYTTQTVGLAYSYTKAKNMRLNVGLDYLMASQNNDQTQLWSGRVQSKFNFTSLQPSIRLRMSPTTNQNINIDLRMYSGFPSITQLQDVLDVTDPLNVSKGNPNLEQSTTAMFRASYNIANTTKNTNFNFMLMGNLTNNNITRHQMIIQGDSTINGTNLVNGASYTTYINMDNALSASMFATYSFGIKPIKSNMNVSVNYRYSSKPGMMNNLKYVSDDNTMGANISLTSNISENVDFTFAYRPSLTFNESTNSQFNRYVYHRFSGFLNVYFTKNLFINVDASWNNTLGTQNGSDQHFTLINAAIGYKLFKHRQGEIKVQGYDLLNQNRSYYQTAAETYIQTSTNYEILKRYFMLSFTYKFDTRKSGSQATSNSDNSDGRQMRMPMGMGMGHR